MKKSLLVAACLALGTSFASAAITPAQIPASATGLAVMDLRAIHVSPFWTAVEKNLTPVQKKDTFVRGFSDGTVAMVTSCAVKDGAGFYVETTQDPETLVTATWAQKKDYTLVPCTICGHKAYRCDFSKSIKASNDPEAVKAAKDGMAIVMIGPRLFLILAREEKKGGLKPDFEKLAALFLDPKAPKLAPTSKLAKFLVLPAGQWAYGALTGIDKELKSAAENDPQAAAMNPMSGFSGIKSVTVKLGPGQAPASAALALRASCADEQSAAGVVGLATMMKGMIAMGGANGKSSMPPELTAFINGIAITQDGKRINVATEVSAAVVKALVDAQAKAATAPKHAVPASSVSPADADL